MKKFDKKSQTSEKLTKSDKLALSRYKLVKKCHKKWQTGAKKLQTCDKKWQISKKKSQTCKKKWEKMTDTN